MAACVVQIKQGRRYGLCGHNGCGKSTLMRSIASGKLDGFPSQDVLRTEYVEHDLDSSLVDLSPVQYLVQEEMLVAKGVDDAKARDALTTMGFSEAMQEAPISKLSGGWKMKLALARAMLIEADVLLLGERGGLTIMGPVYSFGPNTPHRLFACSRALVPCGALRIQWPLLPHIYWPLSPGCGVCRTSSCSPGEAVAFLCDADEPTNHLDVVNIAWLEKYLTGPLCQKVSALIVSHDSGFLDNVCTDIIHYEKRKLKHYRGNLSAFVKVKPEARVYYDLQVRAEDRNKRSWSEVLHDKRGVQHCLKLNSTCYAMGRPCEHQMLCISMFLLF